MPLLSPRAAADPGSPGGILPWWLLFLSMLLLALSIRFGSLPVDGFVALWLAYVVAWPSHAVEALRRQLLLWVFPLVAVASISWSVARDDTLRHSLELLLTTAISIVAAHSVSPRRFLSAFVCALVPAVLIGGALGDTQYTETMQVADLGIFGSKNFFALFACLILFGSTAVVAERRQPLLVRLIGVVGLIAGPFLLWRARSVGALLVAGPCLGVMLTVMSLKLLRRKLRPIAVLGYAGVAAALAVMLAVAISSEKNLLLNDLGKESDLTGRAYLWYRAGFLIEQRPLLGVGYQAFWVRGNPEAEGLWRAEHIEVRGGFHFHNFYYETAIELGNLGFALITAEFVIVGIGIIVWALRQPGGESAFFCAIVMFYLLRSVAEVDFFGPFGVTAMLLPVGWIYAGLAAAAPSRLATSAVARDLPEMARAYGRPVYKGR